MSNACKSLLHIYQISPEVVIKKFYVEEVGPEYYFPVDIRWEFPSEFLVLDRKLGEGAFGEVHLGIANGILEPGISTKVAVKSLKRK